MFFTHDRSFEEFFCICIQLLNKTWKEMRATSEDFNKVPHSLLLSVLSTFTDQSRSPLNTISWF
jgi:engulfment/cell motility protein 1